VDVNRITNEDGSVFNQPVLQNDFTVIAGETNGFGWRADDFGDYQSSAAWMKRDGLFGRRADGIIGYWGDRDVFRFTTDGGSTRVSLDGPTTNSNLIGQITLFGDNGTVASSMMAWNSNHTELEANIPAGTYYVSVESIGGLDNLGMYTLSVNTPSWLVTELDSDILDYALDSTAWIDNGAADQLPDLPMIDDSWWQIDMPWIVDQVDDANEIVPEPTPENPEVVDQVLLGDTNGDGRFDSSDLVLVFQAGKYENAIAGDSVFAEGDWNGDGDFDSSDLVLAFQLGTYEA
jgi:hypothetical protein